MTPSGIELATFRLVAQCLKIPELTDYNFLPDPNPFFIHHSFCPFGNDSVKEEGDKLGDMYERNKGEDEDKVDHDNGNMLATKLAVL